MLTEAPRKLEGKIGVLTRVGFAVLRLDSFMCRGVVGYIVDTESSWNRVLRFIIKRNLLLAGDLL